MAKPPSSTEMNAGSRLHLIGRILMTAATLMYGLAPPLVDFTTTHVLNPDWTSHARLHTVWLIVTSSALAAFALYLLWFRPGSRSMVLILGLSVLGGFFVSAASAPLYGGALHDEGGVPLMLGMDANLFSFSLAFLLLLSGFFLSRPAASEG